MQITIHGQTKYIPVSTITLQKEGDGVTYPFHCTSCGNTLCIVGGTVTKIYPILEPSEQITIVQTCRSCKAKYTFQESGIEEQETVRVLLSPKDENQPFYCYLGGGENKFINKILEYNKAHVYSFAYRKDVLAPFQTRCTNPDCHLVYQFTQFS